MSNNLLPSNATTLERNLATVGADVVDVPVIVKQVWNADTCPTDVLPVACLGAVCGFLGFQLDGGAETRGY